MTDIMEWSADDTSVRVALRVRPQLAREKIDMCRVVTAIPPGEAQVIMGGDKAFTYDYAFDMDTAQDQIYDQCVRALIEGCFDGYNATIFAYGQTGSGKTFTMGTGFDVNISPDDIGIIPRSVKHLFNGITERKKLAQEKGEPLPDFKVNAQFMELYNEDIFDLLDTTRDPDSKRTKSHVRIHEDASGEIYTMGVTTRPVNSLADTMQCLKVGSLLRSTASTNMNSQSSRSHAIFTLHVKQYRIVRSDDQVVGDEAKDTDTTEMEPEFETLTAKFHFVDLAGSERLKRTGATGDRAKEGISINCGLLALGNVISALGDKTKKGSHVPYRDSKLTRLLQDSLGGNSRTTMIACVSPSDRDFMETLNTLKYANRARNIKNKVTANQDKTSRQLNALRSEIQALRAELMEYKQGKRVVDAEGGESYSDMYQEVNMLTSENSNLRQRVKSLQETIEQLRARNVQLMSDQASTIIKNIPDGDTVEVSSLVQGYIKEMEELRTKLMEAEAMCDSMKRASTRAPTRLSLGSPLQPNMLTMPMHDLQTSPRDDMQSVINFAKKDLKKLRRKARPQHDSASEEPASDEEAKSDEEASDNEAEDGDEGDEEMDEEITSDSESEDKDSDNMHEDLADLTCEISIKEKLIEELEVSQKRLHSLKVQYEEKLDQLASRIKETELERDKVLSNLGNLEHLTEEKTKKIKLEYEKKIKEMSSEMKKLQAAQKEHAKLLRNHAQHDKQLKTLQHELAEMKKTKVKLMKDIKRETERSRAVETRSNKELHALRKQQREKDNLIRTLEAQKNQKEAILRRKQEEVEALRRRNKPMSEKAAGRVGNYGARGKNSNGATSGATSGIPSQPTSKKRVKRLFSSKAAKQKWDSVEKCVTSTVTKKKTLGHMEKDMEHWLKQRERSSKKLEKLVAKRDKVIADDQFEQVKDLNEEIGVLIGDINYIQDNITDCQNSIMQMEEEMKEELDIASVVKTCSMEEAQYLLEHLTETVISYGLQSAQKEAEHRELELRLEQHERDSAMHRTLLQQVIADQLNIEVEGLWGTGENGEESSNSSRSTTPVDGLLEAPDTGNSAGSGGSTQSMSEVQPQARKDKARRKTATTADLLGTASSGSTERLLPALHSAPAPPLPDDKLRLPVIEEVHWVVSDLDIKTRLLNNNNEESKEIVVTEPSPPPSPKMQPKQKLLGVFNGGTYENLSISDEKNESKKVDSSMMPPPKMPAPRSTNQANSKNKVEPSPVLRRRNADKTIGSGTGDGVPQVSPALGRRNRETRDENVFNRLITKGQSSGSGNRGRITSFSSRLHSSKNCPLVCTHRATGHTKAVLSVCATDELLFSSSKDTTAKVWDLRSSQELAVLADHPNNVSCVRYSEQSKLAFTVSSSFIKVWDLRQNNNQCIRTLNSSGMTINGSIPLDSAPGRQLNSGDPVIYDVALNHDGTVLYSVCGSIIRTWDLRKFLAVGKLSGGHTSAVMVLAADRHGDKNVLVSGGKDHYVKVFQLDNNVSGVTTATANLTPPHYDGIQSLALSGDTLFSGSRDYCIKKWDLTDYSLKQSLNGAHKDWICALSILPGGTLLSGCRGGVLKLWDVQSCTPLGEVKGHKSAVNAVATNTTSIFTASNNGEIGIWPMPSVDKSTDV